VFKNNTDAREFYEKRGYTRDETCPSLDGTDVDYLILSRYPQTTK
jgi:hypothetical protein